MPLKYDNFRIWQDVNKCVRLTVFSSFHKFPSKILKRSAFLELDNGDKNTEDSSRLVFPHFAEYFAVTG